MMNCFHMCLLFGFRFELFSANITKEFHIIFYEFFNLKINVSTLDLKVRMNVTSTAERFYSLRHLLYQLTVH